VAVLVANGNGGNRSLRAPLARALASAGLAVLLFDIEGACAYVEGGRAVAHICVEDADGARRALREAGLEVTGERDVILVQLEDRPGVLGGVTRGIGDAGVNLELAYLATGTRLVVAADDLDRAEGAI
jgi:hypothetical protein